MKKTRFCFFFLAVYPHPCNARSCVGIRDDGIHELAYEFYAQQGPRAFSARTTLM